MNKNRDESIPEAEAVPKWEQSNGQFTAPAQFQEETEMGGSGGYVAQCNAAVRKGFIRKVYGILSLQLLLTGIMCAAVLSNRGEDVNGWGTLGWGSTLARSSALYWCIFLLSIALLFSLFCYKNSYPMNVYLLGAWTFSMGLTVATACAVNMCDPLVSPDGTGAGAVPWSEASGLYSLVGGKVLCAVGTEAADQGIQSVILAAFTTMAIFATLTVFTFQSKIDFSFLGIGLGAALLMLIVWGFIMAIFGIGSRFLYAMAGSIIFSLYIVYDTWRLANVYGPDDYILAAIDLYLDIINLFVMLLSLFSNRD